jgi:hypothetical protein
MATQILKSIKGKVVRLTRLDDCGEVVEGSCTTVVSDCFVSVTMAAEVEEGDEYLQKNAFGDFCINDKDVDRIKRVNVSIEFAEINPDSLDIIANAQPVVSGGNTIGSTIGPDTQSAAFALEVWTKRTNPDGACDPDAPQWGYFVAPFVKNGRVDGDITIENGALTMSVVGQAFEAPASWGDTPYTSNPFVETFPTGDFMGMVVTTVQPPAVTNGCVAYVAPS